MASSEMEQELQATILRGMPTALKMPVFAAKKQTFEVQKSCIEGLDSLSNTAGQLRAFAEPDFIASLDEMAKEYVAVQAQLEAYKAALERMERTVESGEPTADQMEALVNASTHAQQVDVTRHEQYKRFCEKAGIELEGDDDEDLVVQQSESMRSTICPITQLEMVNPMRNANCGHTYSDAGIRAHLNKSNKCPVAGCPQRMSVSDLERDVEMEVLIANRRKSSTQQQSQARRASTAAFVDDDEEEEEYMVE